MKNKIFFAITFLFLFLNACTKTSINDEPNANQGGDASFTLFGAPNNCDGFTVLGSYIENVQTDITNSVNLMVNVTKIGKWNISTGRLDGLQFSGAGTFTTKGRQSISLAASGKPKVSGIYNFTPGNMPCSFQINVQPNNSNLNTAKFSFKSAADTCTNPNVHGTYELGKTMDSNVNYVVLLADVTTPGTYNIYTNSGNGIRFFAQGNFTSAGPNQPVVFKAAGQSILPGKAYFKNDNGKNVIFDFTLPVPSSVIAGYRN